MQEPGQTCAKGLEERVHSAKEPGDAEKLLRDQSAVFQRLSGRVSVAASPMITPSARVHDTA